MSTFYTQFPIPFEYLNFFGTALSFREFFGKIGIGIGKTSCCKKGKQNLHKIYVKLKDFIQSDLNEILLVKFSRNLQSKVTLNDRSYKSAGIKGINEKVVQIITH